MALSYCGLLKIKTLENTIYNKQTKNTNTNKINNKVTCSLLLRQCHGN